jgi:antirestriction protein
MILDHLDLPEIDDLGDLVMVSELLKEHGRAVLAYFDMGYDDPESFEGQYIGAYSSVREYAEELIDSHEIPGDIEFYLDWEGYCRQLEISLHIHRSQEGVYIFNY